MKHIDNIISETIHKYINEGIDFDRQNQTVSFVPDKEDNVDTSIETNPTMDNTIVPNVNVWPIFKRKQGNRGDGNPLIYALKGENNWRFKTPADRLSIEMQFNKIAKKFAKQYPIGVTVLVPSGNDLNEYIAQVVLSNSKNARLLKGIVCKLTTDEVEDIVMRQDSKFRQYYGDNFNSAFEELSLFLEDMDNQRGGAFSRHLIKDKTMRNVLDFTFKCSKDKYAKYANEINGQNLLIIDDTISRGQSIREICRIMQESYSPKSITVLTLSSKLY